MFKVECPGCKAPYQVDERRVPSGGLKMRCPKCGTSFQVEPPPSEAGAGEQSPVLGLGGDVAAGARKPPLPNRPKPAVKGTMIGVAPPLARPPGVPKAMIPRPKPSSPSSQEDLPAVVAPRKLSAGDLPTVSGAEARPQPRRPPPPRPKKTAAGGPSPAPAPGFPGEGEVDLPAVPRREQAGDAAGFEEADLPVAAPAGRAGRTLQGHVALPGLGNSADPFGLEAEEAALPAVARPRSPAADPFGNVDLPSNVEGDPFAEQAELPSIPDQDVGFGELDLPSPAGSVDLPTARTGSDLPSPVTADLPSPAGYDVPSVGSSEVELPTAFDLPSPGTGAELPSPGAAFGELELPMPGGALPDFGGLPAADAGLPAAGAALPSTGGELPGIGGELPSIGGELPSTGGELPDLGAEPPTAGHGGELEFGEVDPFAAPPPDAFGAHEPPGQVPDPFGAPPGAEAFGAPVSPDPFNAPPGAASPFAGTSNDGSSDAADPFGAAEAGPDPFQSARFGESAAPPARPSNRPGPAAYGEVDLGGGEEPGSVALDAAELGDQTAGMEFGDIPEEGKPRPPLSVGGPMHVQLVAAGGEAVAEIQSRKRRSRLHWAIATLVVTAVGGGALALVPHIGPFGAYFIIDQLKGGDYERLLGATVKETREQLAIDTYPSAKRAFDLAEDARKRAPRFGALKAYAAFVGFLRVLRFGSEPQVQARARVLIDELKADPSADKVELAQAALAGVDGQLARARQALDQLGKKHPKDIDVLIARGEVELRARDHAAAIRIWGLASKLEQSARTAYGLARAQFAAGDMNLALQLSEQAMERNPQHAGARILLAHIAWRTEQDEPRAAQLLHQVVETPASASPEEIVRAQTLLGEIHLSRGRITKAEEAFGFALKINPRAARALSGFGDALFKAGRYAQALARFKASTQADPNEIRAKVGVAKASIQLERLEEAKTMLDKLRASHPEDMDVAFWFGRVQEALGQREEAEKAYRVAIEVGGKTPEAVDAFVALAMLQNQQGRPAEAHETLESAQERLPNSPAIHKAIGKVAVAQGRYKDGLEEFKAALALDAEDVEARFLTGTTYSRLRNFDAALAVFDEVAKVDRDFPGLALERGLLYQDSGRLDDALQEYEAALAKAPNDLDLMLRVGCGKATAGSGAAAEKVLTKVLEQRPNSAETHHCLGRALLARNNLGDALHQFKRAIQIDPNRAEYYLYLGWASNEAGNFAAASVALKKALELDQGLADAYWQRAVLRLRQSRAKDAIDDLKKALELKPSRFEAQADLAQAYYDLGMEQPAMEEWRSAIAANPEQATWRFRYGKLLNLNLRHGEAAQHLSKALEIAETEQQHPAWAPEAHRLLAVSLGNSSDAIEHWEAFLRTGPSDSPFRPEARAVLKRLGKPWDGE